MKKAQILLMGKMAGLLSAAIVLMLGVSGCKSRHATKYGPPPVDYNNTITKYGAPDDYDSPVTKYGAPVPLKDSVIIVEPDEQQSEDKQE
ncbi:MAG TPA: hypothetical protein PLM49_02680 [Bacteroidales bacterium]|nr:hypothetical protein [Bacteroidales bacterium]